jgi:hypothetical protein
MKIVEKWIAGFWVDELIVIKAKFKETPKQFTLIQEDCTEGDRASSAIGYVTNIPKNGDRIHDTPEEALNALHKRELNTLNNLRWQLETTQNKMNQINTFDWTTL